VSAVPGDALLEVDHLGAGYGDLRVVWDVSLAVYAGQTSLVLGRNGAGKTTTLKACAGVVRMMGGSVRLQGEDLVDTGAEGEAVGQHAERADPGGLRGDEAGNLAGGDIDDLHTRGVL